MLIELAAILTVTFPPNDADRDGIVDAVDSCIFVRNVFRQDLDCTDLGALEPLRDAYGQVDVFLGRTVVLIRNLDLGVMPPFDQDGDGVPDYRDPCVFVPGTDSDLCWYDLDWNGRMDRDDLRTWQRRKQDFNGDGRANGVDRWILRKAIRRNIRRGIGCIYSVDESADKDGVAVCLGATSIAIVP